MSVEASDDQGPLFELAGTVPLEGGVASLWLDCDGDLSLDGRVHLVEHERMSVSA